MTADYLTTEEQEAYERVVTSINKYVFTEGHRVKVIEALDNLVDILMKGDL